MSKVAKMVDMLDVGVVQTTMDAVQAWRSTASAPQMSPAQDERAWQEICKAFRSFQDRKPCPQVILLPELSLPRTRLDDLERLAAALGVITVAGVDYRLDRANRIARNQGIIFVPRGFFRKQPSAHCTRVVFGKTYPAPSERSKLGRLTPPWSFQGDQNVYVFDCGMYGRIGVSICYDFMDIERALMYRGRIQHLLVLAYNRDLGMFRSLADSLSRTVFCNVVVCNTGFWGGSIAVCPRFEAHARTLFAHDGNGMFTTQVVRLPVAGLIQAQQGQIHKSCVTREIRDFKDTPPGFATQGQLALKRRRIVLD